MFTSGRYCKFFFICAHFAEICGVARENIWVVGDSYNDLSMLEAADHAFCPADSVIADRFSNVCCCAEGAVADVIYNKIPEILKG